ncbi:MAG: hypothetical protein CEE41_05135 [Hadesarchaea archaeon B3_Hades]|nr:MAG: hypothetical protein CEE41_05135 [Hadesarchaea archaeon B3_Hades]
MLIELGGQKMNATKHAVVVSLFASMQSGKQHYTKASVDRTIELLDRFHNIRVKRRWLFSCLEHLEGKGYIRRKERYYRNPDGTFVQLSSMISFTLRGVRYMVSKRISGAKKLLDRMLSWYQRRDGRFPKADPELEKFTPLETEKNLRRVKELILSIK